MNWSVSLGITLILVSWIMRSLREAQRYEEQQKELSFYKNAYVAAQHQFRASYSDGVWVRNYP